MRILLVISLIALMECAPIDNDIEIEKQNLVRFPEDPKPFNNPQSDTQRILEEIEKINIKLGYKKFKSPSLHNSNQFLYTKPSFNSYGTIGLVGGGKLEPSIRSINSFQTSKIMERLRNPNYYRIPVRLLRMSKNNYIKSSNASIIKTKGYKIIGNFDSQNSLLKDSTLNSTNSSVKVFLIPFSKLDELKQLNLSKNNKQNNWEAINIKKHKEINPNSAERTLTNNFNQISRPLNDSRTSSHHYNNVPKPINQNKPAVILQSIKSSINSLINKPTMKPIKQNVLADKPKNHTQIKENYDDYYDSEEKTFLSTIKKQSIKDQNETLKDGGIIIQRLKVRRGGIAIAGPGGIATAGSGGTAIVGPNGIALTHPKSLTIAGPGAKILAYPSETDLKDVLLNANNDDTILQNGKIVATGPAIYYNNER